MRKMKDSGIEWIGEIPKEWEVSKIKYVSDIYTGNSIKDNEKSKYEDSQDAVPYLSSKDINAENNTADYTNGMYVKEKDSSFKFAQKDSTLMCIEGGSAGRKKTFLNQKCAFVNKLCCFKPKKINPKFLFLLLNSPNFENEFKLHISGLIGGVSTSVLKNFACPLPPTATQQRIADFLDAKCAKIDSLKSDIQKQIETLEQYKKSVITEAVTKGLNPNAKMKDSGVEWIGEINVTAEIIRLKFYSYMKGRIGWQGLKSTDFIDEGPYCITGTDFINGKVNWGTCYHVSEQRYAMDKNIQIKKGDLLMTKDGTIGKLAIIDELPNKACLNSHLLIIRPLNNKYTNKYLFYVMKSHLFSKYYTIVSSGTTMDSLSQEKTGDFSLPVYEIDVQNKIVDFLDLKCTKIDNIIASKKQQLEKLEEYKKSFIFEYVTGKKEV